ncbi:tape measure protein, partial [Riemerella columbina]|uniref:tape measure protein n=1 Tax=Riemerella columbina TaxID=103810 RepID=UPI0005257626
LAELAKKFGKTTGEIQKMVSEGKIGFKDVKEVLFSLTDEGGMFFNLMDKQSASLSGKISNLGDAFDQMLNKVGESNEGILNKGIDGLTYLVEHYEDVIKVLTILVSTYGSYRAALIVTSLLQKAQVTQQSILAWLSLAKSIRTVKDAQALLNFTMSANPIGAIIALIGLLTASYVTYGDEIKRLIGITKEATAEMKVQEEVDKKLTDTFSKGVVEKRAKIESLMAVINNENSTLEQRQRAYENLIKIDPSFRDTLDSQYKATYRLGDAFDHVIKKMQDFALAQAKMAVVKDILERSAKAELDESMAKTRYENAKKLEEKLTRLVKEGKITNAERESKLLSAYPDIQKLGAKVIETERKVKEETQKATEALTVQNSEIHKAQKTLERINKKEKSGWKMQDGRKYATKYIEEFRQQREQAKTILTGYGILEEVPETIDNATENTKKKAKKHQKALAEIYSKDSIKDLEERISLLNNA